MMKSSYLIGKIKHKYSVSKNLNKIVSIVFILNLLNIFFTILCLILLIKKLNVPIDILKNERTGLNINVNI